MTTPITTSTTDSQMHNNIMAAGSRDRPPMLATRRYAQWRSDSYDTLIQDQIEHIYESEKERFIRILTGIGDEYTQQLMYVRQAQNGEALESYNKCYDASQCSISSTLPTKWSRFVTIVKQQHKLDEVSYHKLFDILKQYQKEVNELRAEKMAKNANPLALISCNYKDNKGKEIVKPITPPSESASEEDSDPEQAQKDKDMQKKKKFYKLSLRSTSRNSTNLPTTTSEVPQTPETRMWILLQDMDEEIDEQELEAHYSYMEKIQEVPNADSGTDAEPLEQEQYDILTIMLEIGDSNVTPDSLDMCDNDIQDDQNDVECDDERVALANLIA
ncbi:hypothetical protein Tco_1028664 [Tanacetum coccineum]|uniref:Uncharacterized protein n=1 Tax=Tanacetum coccineum TaxID=301880 RepID=A0ABQ5G2H0_9ASTR